MMNEQKHSITQQVILRIELGRVRGGGRRRRRRRRRRPQMSKYVCPEGVNDFLTLYYSSESTDITAK
jgi:hypothetical protein